MYTITDQIIHYNFDPSRKLSPKGLVIHSTATPNATAENEVNYFDSGNHDASAHFFVDYASIIRAVPEDVQAWHAGHIANASFIGIELCEFADATKFSETWKRGVWLAASLAIKWGFGIDKVYSHHNISDMYKETDHTDPDPHFSAHKTTFDQFKTEVAAMIKTLTTPTCPATYTVVSGDSLWGISNRFGVAIGTIRSNNFLTSDVLTIGQVLYLTTQAPAFTLTSGGKQVGAYGTQNDALTAGWKLYNGGQTDVVMTAIDKSIYTFDKHQDLNPDINKALVYLATTKFGLNSPDLWYQGLTGQHQVTAQELIFLFQAITK